MRLYDDITSDGSKPRVRFNWRSSREQPADVPGLELVFDGRGLHLFAFQLNLSCV